MEEIMDGQDEKNYDDIESTIRDIDDIPEEEKAKNFAYDDDGAKAEIEDDEKKSFIAQSRTALAAAPSWRAAKSLLTLRTQINQKAPNRNKASDGTIGDARHCGGNPTAS